MYTYTHETKEQTQENIHSEGDSTPIYPIPAITVRLKLVLL
jgi:hypothetical protein